MKPKKLLFPLLFITPFVLGTAGYLIAGVGVTDALYSAFGLYLVSPSSDAYNLFIEIARWLAPLVMAGGILLVMKNAVRRFLNMLSAKRKNSFAICGDAPQCAALKDNLGKKAFLSGDGRLYGAKNAVLFFKNENDGFAFYRKNEAQLQGKNVYIRAESMDMYYVPDQGFRLFNLTELAMKEFWSRFSLAPLLEKKNGKLSVVLIGGGHAGNKLLENAVLNNVFSAEQQITYHVFENTAFAGGLHGDLQLMNADRLVCHSEPWYQAQDVLEGADRIVFADTPDAETLLSLADRCRGAEIFCRGISEDLLRLAGKANVRLFGDESAFLTEDHITGKGLYDAAKQLNFAYACMYGGADPADASAVQTEWEKLDPFTMHSNIASTAYHAVRMQLHPTLTSEQVDDALAELEHVRWCRFHFWYHWKYGASPAGKKDAVNRLHPCLVPFAQLSRTDKDKDIDAIKVLLSACAGN